jgi:hypothetical protein
VANEIEKWLATYCAGRGVTQRHRGWLRSASHLDGTGEDSIGSGGDGAGSQSRIPLDSRSPGLADPGPVSYHSNIPQF